MASLLRWSPLLALLALSGCDCDGSPAFPPGSEGAPCDTEGECNDGLTCRDGRCAAAPDAGDRDGGDVPGEDAGPMCLPSRTCGDECCEETETCDGARCCAVADLCGGVCCGADQACEAARCVLRCEAPETACGSGDDAVCCAGGDVCYLGACLTPGDACTRTSDCPDGDYCETTVMRCLPRATGEMCEYRPPVGPLELEEQWHWDGDDAVLPSHDQVMMAPMVANLTDDDGDGDIDTDDIPDVVFHTFTGSDYWGNGILRAVSGLDGSRVWPTADPGYRTTPGGEVAIADVDPASPGPEIMACSASMRPNVAGHLMIIAADGTLIRRFDTAPNNVPCGFDAPMVGDMNGDGTPEIVVRFVIAHADGTVVRRIRDAGSASWPYITLADIDGDMDLELVASNAAYDYDGTPVWDRSEGAEALPGSGWLAVADLDLNGTPEVVIVGGGHFIRAVDGATGADVWGPIDINPPELAADVAANGNPNGGGPPTIANFDDDPNPEIAFAGGFAYVIFGHDGSRQWYYTTQDRSSRSTGSSIFDFEGDGVAEVLYNDEIRFRVFRGPDGSVLHDECNTSGTLREFPIVVDVDNDDQAEIVVMENDYASGLTCTGEPNGHGIHVLQHPLGQWVRTRRIFNQHTYHVTNIEEDGTVPVRETPNWTVPTLNNFRQNVQPEGLFDAPDAVLADLFAITSGCPSEIGLSVRVVNRGAAGMPAGIPVTFYRDEAGTRTLLGRAFTTRALLPGESEVVVLDAPFAVPAGMDGATFTFVAVVNDPDDMPVPTFNQCRTENDTSELLEASCPIIE